MNAIGDFTLLRDNFTKDEFIKLRPDDLCTLVFNGFSRKTSFFEKIKSIIMLGRLRTCIPGLVCFALGIGYTSMTFSWQLILGATLCFFGAFLANIENAYTDIPEDAHNLPSRIFLVVNVGHTGLHHAIVVINLSMLAISAFFGLACFITMVIALILVHQYSYLPLRAKNRPLIGLIVFAQVVAFPFFIPSVAEPGSPLLLRPIEYFIQSDNSVNWVNDKELLESLRFFMMWLFINVWFFAKGMFKNIPDYAGDLAAGLKTSATVFKTRKKAAIATTAVTIGAYSFLIVPVWLRLESPNLLWALIWLIPVTYNLIRLITYEEHSKLNDFLKFDMLLSIGFIFTLLFLLSFNAITLALLAVTGAVLLISDLLRLDSRVK